ncbi:MAG: hypothetical protein GWP14_08870 [Actinobacteria bacterium]|nr:hypothetical protein [Actinomycetota bacterium]
MSLVDVPQNEITATDVANDIRGHLASVVSLADVRLLQIRNLVRDYGRANISTELGSDAADMLTVYTKLKEAIEAAKNVTVEELP